MTKDISSLLNGYKEPKPFVPSKDWAERFREGYKQGKTRLKATDGTPKCPYCAERMFNAVDRKENKVSKYLWKCKCKDFPKHLVVSLG